MAVIFVVTKAFEWGINITVGDKDSISYVPPAMIDFNKLTGTLTLSFFIHNAVVALVRNNKNPKNNVSFSCLPLLCLLNKLLSIIICLSN